MTRSKKKKVTVIETEAPTELPLDDEELELTPETQELLEERIEEVKAGNVITTEELRERISKRDPAVMHDNGGSWVANHNRQFETKHLPSHWAREEGKDPHLFLWWDNREGIVTQQRYEEIKKQL